MDIFTAFLQSLSAKRALLYLKTTVFCTALQKTVYAVIVPDFSFGRKQIFPFFLYRKICELYRAKTLLY